MFSKSKVTGNSKAIRVFLSSILIFCSYVSQCEAKVTGIFIWAVDDPKLQLVLPAIEGIPSGEVLEKLKVALLKNPNYSDFRTYFEGKGDVFLPLKKGKAVASAISSPESLNLAIIANHPGTLSLKDPKKKALVQSFTQAGASVFIIPFGINALLTDPTDLADYHSFITKAFPALLAPGGADIDPTFYRQKNTASKNINSLRDDEDLKLIKSYVEAGTGVFYGICRGHQAYVIAMGGDLYQDISLEGIPTKIHDSKKTADGREISNWHEIQLANKNNALFEATGKDHFQVNSRHHQAVKTIADGQGQVIAREEGKVVEAIEKRDTKGRVKVLTVQFHPEDMNTEESKKILRWMVKNALDQKD